MRKQLLVPDVAHTVDETAEVSFVAHAQSVAFVEHQNNLVEAVQ